jgi:hypothetical protein
MLAVLAGVVHKRQGAATPSTRAIRTITNGVFIADLVHAGPETLSPPASYWRSNEP